MVHFEKLSFCSGGNLGGMIYNFLFGMNKNDLMRNWELTFHNLRVASNCGFITFWYLKGQSLEFDLYEESSGCSVKKEFLTISQNSGKYLSQSLFFEVSLYPKYRMLVAQISRYISIEHFQLALGNIRTMRKICSKLTIKTLERLLTSFWCLCCLLWIDFTHCSGVSIVNFEQVNPRCACC